MIHRAQFTEDFNVDMFTPALACHVCSDNATLYLYNNPWRMVICSRISERDIRLPKSASYWHHEPMVMTSWIGFTRSTVATIVLSEWIEWDRAELAKRCETAIMGADPWSKKYETMEYETMISLLSDRWIPE